MLVKEYPICQNFWYTFLGYLQIKIAPKVIQNEPRDDSMTNELEADKQGSDIKSYATLEELKSGKLPPEEILSLPMFKVLNVIKSGDCTYNNQYYLHRIYKKEKEIIK